MDQDKPWNPWIRPENLIKPKFLSLTLMAPEWKEPQTFSAPKNAPGLTGKSKGNSFPRLFRFNRKNGGIPKGQKVFGSFPSNPKGLNQIPSFGTQKPINLTGHPVLNPSFPRGIKPKAGNPVLARNRVIPSKCRERMPKQFHPVRIPRPVVGPMPGFQVTNS